MKRLPVILAVAALLAGSTALAGKPEYKVKPAEVRALSSGMQRQIAGLQYVLNAHQIQQFFALPDDDARSEWVARFWKSNDPTPTTAKNEMEVEHNIRVNLVRQFFARDEWPGWDKRGEVYIRYGPPNYRGIIHAEVTVRKVHPPGELWYYSRHDMVVSFQDFNLNGNYIYSINPFGALQDMDSELVEFLAFDTDESLEQSISQDLLTSYRDAETDPDGTPAWGPLEDAIIGPRPRKIIRERMRRVNEGMDELTNPDTPNMTPDDPSQQFLMRKAEDMAANYEGVLEDTPSSYPHNFQMQKQLPFFYNVGQFKAGEGVNRVEVNMQFPVDPAAADEERDTRTYVATTVCYDKDYNEVARDNTEIVLPVRRGENEETQYWPIQLRHSLGRDYYRVAVSVDEVETGRQSAYWSTLEFRDYGEDLAISDILFATKIEPATRQSPFTRGAVEVVPHPLRRYRQGSAVPVYFEVYNLGINEEGLSSYEVEYRIVPHSPRKKRFWDRFDGDSPAVSSRFESSGYNADEPLYITVQTENLEPGAYDFLITVKDVYWQSVTYRRATFRIVE